MTETIRPQTPIWYWVVAVFAVAWNAIGVMDYYNSITLNVDYLSEFPGMIEFVKEMPMWAKIAWGIAIGGSILGAVALLLRSRWAVTLYIIAIIGMFISFFYQWTAPNMPVVPAWTHIFTVLIWVLAFFFLWFSHKMKKRGILR